MAKDWLIEKVERDSEAMAKVEPLSIEGQWSEVQGWYEYFEAHRGEDRPVIESLLEQWDAIQHTTGMTNEEYRRGSDLNQTASSPLSTLFYFLDMGFYPPPELLFGLMDAWNRYMRAGGQLDLEEAFFGPRKKGLGNYAARRRSKFRSLWMSWEFARLLGDGMSRIDAAEELSSRLGGKPDADSILRMLRRVKAWRSLPKKEEK